MSIAIEQIKLLPECISGSFQISDPIMLTFGEQLNSTEISYTVFGNINKPAIAVLGGISANQYVADANVNGSFIKGWWEPMVGYAKTIDLNRYCVVSFNYLDGQSSAASDVNVPGIKISTFDQATILKYVLQELKIKSLHCLIGSSYGGMVGLAFAQKYPHLLKQFISICCTEKSSAKNTAFRSLQRQILAFAVANNDIKQGLILARSLGTLGYRGAKEIDSRFANEININSQQATFPIESYLYSQGVKFAEKFCAKRFHNLSLSVDLHKVEPKKISSPCLCIGIEGDLIAPVSQVQNMVKEIGSLAEFALLKSSAGHDGFLKEYKQLEQIIKTRLESYNV